MVEIQTSLTSSSFQLDCKHPHTLGTDPLKPNWGLEWNISKQGRKKKKKREEEKERRKKRQKNRGGAEGGKKGVIEEERKRRRVEIWERSNR